MAVLEADVPASPAKEIEVTPEMLRAGVERFCDLPLEEVDSTYVVLEVLEAMGLRVSRSSV